MSLSDRGSKASHSQYEDESNSKRLSGGPGGLEKIEEVYNTEYERALANTSLDGLSRRSFQVSD